MKLSFSTLGCPAWPLDTILNRAKQYGYDGMDFRGCLDELKINDINFDVTMLEYRTIDRIKHRPTE